MRQAIYGAILGSILGLSFTAGAEDFKWYDAKKYVADLKLQIQTVKQDVATISVEE